MKKPRIYVDTSVIGGCFDPEFQLWSNGLVEDFRRGRFGLVLSDVTAAEVEPAPRVVRELHRKLLSITEILPITEEATAVLAAYQDHHVLGPRFRNDMLHIALATVAAVDVVVSWNFRHIVRLDKMQQFNGGNLELGYRALAIHSPREVTTYGRESEDPDQSR
ncbi:MAG: type II toxin-antitoxin system VapC family toxin [Planctomycetes bacterium]|nr:type II toxin-antitoxin system VapC family toxin [Planctomycetota bacterium]